MVQKIYFSVFMLLCFSTFLFAQNNDPPPHGAIEEVKPPVGSVLRPGDEIKIYVRRSTAGDRSPRWSQSDIFQLNICESANPSPNPPPPLHTILWVGNTNGLNGQDPRYLIKVQNRLKPYMYTRIGPFDRSHPRNNQIWLDIRIGAGGTNSYRLGPYRYEP